MAFRLFVHARKIRASVEYNSPKVVAPAFRKASVSVSKPTFDAAVEVSEGCTGACKRCLVPYAYPLEGLG